MRSLNHRLLIMAGQASKAALPCCGVMNNDETSRRSHRCFIMQKISIDEKRGQQHETDQCAAV